ncbi:MAG: UvrD-helicase domain-containing protein [Clostridia bacterium]|nr:UvrD-helicase domain-containing protein [Clostridia bacterium]
MLSDRFIQLRKEAIEKSFGRMNDMQRKAIFRTQGPLLVLAGAGSGKTTVLVNRIANIMKFGCAYYSDFCCRPVEQSDIDSINAYLDGDDFAYTYIEDLMQVDAPRPWEILAITFTNKAASELKERLEKMLGPDGNEIWASTFHAACARILRRYGDRIGFSNHFTIYDTDDSRRAMKECQRALNIEDRVINHKAALAEISKAKDSLITPEEFKKSAGNDFRLKKIAELYEMYQANLQRADAMDFDDIITNTVYLLEKDAEVREHYQNRFKYIMVDEYQDTNHAQYRLVELLAAKHRNLCVVGDDDQSIYKFRGATIENILTFEQYFNAEVIRLEQNYRSTQTILDAANAVIANNEQRKGKNLWTDNGEGGKIILNTSYDEQSEARYIADTVLDGVAAGQKYSDFAVLYRANAQSNAVENAFVRMGIPYSIFGGHKFYERKEIRDAIAYLTVINNTADDIRLRRIINEPKRGIGDTSVSHAADIANSLGISLFEVIANADDYPQLSRAAGKMKAFAAMINDCVEKSHELSIKEAFDYLMKESGYVEGLALDAETYTDRLANITELSNNLQRYTEENDEPSLTGFLEEVALMTDLDAMNSEADKAVMMTLHSAKGLEFNNVFIVGMEEGVFPGMQAVYNPAEIEEERRLAYVGITRAKKQLYLTKAKTRMLYGSTTHNRVSRFAAEIPMALIKETGVSQQASPFMSMGGGMGMGRPSSIGKPPVKKPLASSVPKAPAAPVENFNVGDSVSHATFGTGLVLSAKPMGNDVLLEIAFDKAGTKKLMAKFAKLKKN